MKIVFLLVLTMFLASCVNIDYQPFKVMSGGYKDDPLGDGKHSVSYEMYGKVDHALVYERWHMRAGELCENGYDVLELVRSDIETETAVSSGGTLAPMIFSDPRYVGTIRCKN